jgi:Fe-S cluster biogenesis protein NfuA
MTETDTGPEQQGTAGRDPAAVEADVLAAIEAMRPALAAHGGDIAIRSLGPDGVVHVELLGACGTCPVSMMTLKAGVERIIRDRVPEVVEVVADNVDESLVF